MGMPTFKFEKDCWNKGFSLVAGVDEVGRGCFAGPVVAGCVVFDRERVTRVGGPQGRGPVLVSWRKGLGADERQDPRINDSKKLSPRQREIADVWIREYAAAFGIGSASVAQINKFGIKKATEIAFRKAILSANSCLQTTDYRLQTVEKAVVRRQLAIDYLLIDAFYIPYVKGLRRRNQKAIVKGDSLSFSIAAASIVAKVHRDKLMVSLSKKPKYKKYNWHKNKGYGTKEHQKMIRKHGISRLHRTRFVETFLART